MKPTGIVRKVDELGRIVLPVELRRILGIETQDEMEIFIDHGKIILEKFQPSCIFCGSSQGLAVFKEKNICQDCMKRIGKSV